MESLMRLSVPGRGFLRLRSYCRARPAVTCSVLGVALFGAGDLMAQRYEDPSAPTNWARTGCMAGLGVVLNGAGLYGWYTVLEKVAPGRGLSAVCKKIVVEQLTWAPLVLSTQLAYTSLVQRHACDRHACDGPAVSASENIRAKFKDAYICDWMTWPLANLVAFSYVPIVFRPAFIGCVQLWFQAYMSKLGNERPTQLTGSVSTPLGDYGRETEYSTSHYSAATASAVVRSTAPATLRAASPLSHTRAGATPEFDDCESPLASSLSPWLYRPWVR